MVKNWLGLLRWVRSMLMRRGRSSDEADDLVQEAWLRYAAYERDTPVAKPGAFLLRIAMNLAVNADRARAARPEDVHIDDVSLVDPSACTEDAVLARERIARLDTCLEHLGATTQAIFLDIHLVGMSYPEAARRHRMSVSGVEKHVAKATMQLAHWMEGW